MSEDDPIERLKTALSGAPKPKVPPTEADLIALAKTRFADWFAFLERLDETVKAAYDPAAAVIVHELRAEPQNQQVLGAITLRAIGTKPSHAPARRIPFTIQGHAMIVGGGKGSFPGTRQTTTGARYDDHEQKELIDVLVTRVADFYQGRWG